MLAVKLQFQIFWRKVLFEKSDYPYLCRPEKNDL